jgi:hypothetical protein
MLPSTIPFLAEDDFTADGPLQLRGGAKRSKGVHLTARTTDVRAAQAYQKVRTTLHQRNKFWSGEEA